MMALDFNRAPTFGAGVGFGQGVQFGKAADPLANVEYSGDLAADSASELTAMEQAYRDRASAEAGRFQGATDSEFWFAVCFATREEKEDFLKEFKLSQIGDKYLDGGAVARQLRKS